MMIFEFRRDTYNNVVKWLNEIKEYGSENMTLILIGNKSDLEKRFFFLELFKVIFLKIKKKKSSGFNRRG